MPVRLRTQEYGLEPGKTMMAPASRQPGWQKLLPLLPAVVAIMVYAVTAGFTLLSTLDDHYYLSLNDTVTGFTPEHLKEAFSTYYVGNYAPLHILSFMADHAMWGLNPVGYHLENVLWHGLNGLLFALLLTRLGMARWQAAAAAWLFLLHPVQVETVAWISQRKSLLAMFFFLAALHAYHSYLTSRTRKPAFYLLALSSIAAAMLSKSVAVIFPAVALLYDQASPDFPPRPLRKRLFDKVPFVAAAAAVAVMAIISQDQDIGGGRRDYPGGGPVATFFTMVPVLAAYIRDCFWPSGLIPYYEIPIRQQPDGTFLLSLLFLMAVAGVGVMLYRRSRRLLLWYGLFFIALLPVLQIVPLITLKNDRYLYFPLLGFAVLAVAGAGRLSSIPGRLGKPVLVLFSLLLLVLPCLAYRQASFWRDNVTLWTRTVQVDPGNRLGWMQLMKSYTEQGDGPATIKAYNRYMELRNRYGPVRGFEGN